MEKKLQLLINNSQSGPIPPLVKAIRVKDSKSAKRLLSRLIVQIQREEVLNETAKDLTYLVNSFISLMKYAEEEKEISELITTQLSVQLRDLSILMDRFFQEVEAIIPPDKLLLYKQKFDAMSQKFREERATRHKNILKEISSRTSFKPKKQTDETSEEAKARVMNYLRGLPHESFNQVMSEIQREYFSNS